MNRPKIFWSTFAAAAIILIITGIIWRQADIKRMADENYLKTGQLIRRDYFENPEEAVAEIKNTVVDGHMHLIDRIRSDSKTIAYVGSSRSSWLLSGFLHKITVVGVHDLNTDGHSTRGNLIAVYAQSISSRAVAFGAIAFLSIMTLAAAFVKRENIPHLFSEPNQPCQRSRRSK